MQISDVEDALLRSIKQLQFGTLFPREAAASEMKWPAEALAAAELSLLNEARRLGLPREISIADGLPQWAVFEVKLEAGIGHKRIKLA